MHKAMRCSRVQLWQGDPIPPVTTRLHFTNLVRKLRGSEYSFPTATLSCSSRGEKWAVSFMFEPRKTQILCHVPGCNGIHPDCGYIGLHYLATNVMQQLTAFATITPDDKFPLSCLVSTAHQWHTLGTENVGVGVQDMLHATLTDNRRKTRR